MYVNKNEERKYNVLYTYISYMFQSLLTIFSHNKLIYIRKKILLLQQ